MSRTTRSYSYATVSTFHFPAHTSPLSPAIARSGLLQPVTIDGAHTPAASTRTRRQRATCRVRTIHHSFAKCETFRSNFVGERTETSSLFLRNPRQMFEPSRSIFRKPTVCGNAESYCSRTSPRNCRKVHRGFTVNCRPPFHILVGKVPNRFRELLLGVLPHKTFKPVVQKFARLQYVPQHHQIFKHHEVFGVN
jgi:hypothetical protein